MMTGDAELRGRPQHDFAHHAGHAAIADLRREQLAVAHHEDIGRRGADDAVVGRAHQAFVDARVAQLGAGEHLLEAVEVLHARQPRIAAEAGLADAQRQRPRGLGLGHLLCRRDDDARQARLGRGRIAARTGTARQRQLDHGGAEAFERAQAIRLDQVDRRRGHAQPAGSSP